MDWDLGNYAFGAAAGHPLLRAISDNCVRAQTDLGWVQATRFKPQLHLDPTREYLMQNNENLLETDKQPEPYRAALSTTQHLQGKQVAMVVYSYYKFDPRPRRAAEALVGAGMNVELICL